MPTPWDQSDLITALATRGAMSDADAAADINAETYIVHRDVTSEVCRDLMFNTGVWGKIKLRSTRPWMNDGDDALTELCILVIDSLLLQGTVKIADDGNWTLTQTMLGALVTATLISQDVADAFAELRNMHALAWWPPVVEADVTAARA